MKHKYLLLAFVLFIIFESCDNKMSIVLIKGITIDSASNFTKSRATRLDVFLIKNYQNNRNSDQYVDEYVSNNNANRKRYLQYHMLFVKESEKSNLESIRASLKQNGKYVPIQDDLIFDYGWSDFGRIFQKEKAENLIVPNSKNVKIENIPAHN